MATVEWIATTRRPNWPWWAIAVAVLWLALGGVALLLREYVGGDLPLCQVKHLTGLPCPTCGFTRGMLSLLHGHPIEAWLYNPLLFSFLGLSGVVLSIRLLSGRTLAIRPSRRQTKVIWAAIVLLVVTNWLYVIRWVG